MSARRFVAALLFGAFAIAASADEGPLFKIYKQYQAAIAKDDLAAAKKFVSSGKRERLEQMSEQEALASLDVLSPKKKLRVHKEIVDGDDATLIVVADVSGNESAGHIQFAREEGAWKILSELWDLGGNPDESPIAAEDIPKPKNDEQRVAIRKLREKGYPAPSADFMVMAAVEGDLETLKLFLQAGYPIDFKTNDGSPAIVNAAAFDHPEVVMYLIEAGADVNAVDSVNTTALMRMAEKCGATEAVKALLKAGAKLDIKSRGGATALELAQYSQCEENAAAIQAAAKKR